MESAIKKASRDYMRKPQDWLNVASDESISTIESKGKVFHIKISPADFEQVGKYRWYLKDGYAVTSIRGRRTRMHHLIHGKPPKDKVVDHINRDRLDNRRENLRFVPNLQNTQSLVEGKLRKRGSRWETNVCLNKRKIFKSFKNPADALNWRASTKKRFSDHLISGRDAESFFTELLSDKE